MADFPTVSITSPTTGSNAATSPVSLSGEATAGTFDIERIEARASYPQWIPMTLGEGNTWSGSLGLRQGANTVRVRGVDVNGNAGTAASITVTLTSATHVGNNGSFYVGASGASSKFWTGIDW